MILFIWAPLPIATSSWSSSTITTNVAYDGIPTLKAYGILVEYPTTTSILV